ncbi:MAG: adenylate kinase [Verrucomicrobia bacterium]|nr:adenylate kinase [Verrucomicrobiota bacterium]MBS0647458.1 adenylate kinase [Verrucomicrobiota bacterium]
MALLLMGPPGGGKGVQSKILSAKYGWPQISTGDLLRQQIKDCTELGLKVENLTKSGQLVPDSIILDMIFERIQQPDCQKGFILDGCPRTLVQGQLLDQHFQSHHIKTVVLVLDVPDEQIKERLLHRIVCEKCGTPYHTKTLPPKQEGICDRCQGNVIKRPDDSDAIISDRLKIYHQQTEPLFEFYSSKGYLTRIDGTLSKEEVSEKIEQVLTHYTCETTCQ